MTPFDFAWFVISLCWLVLAAVGLAFAVAGAWHVLHTWVAGGREVPRSNPPSPRSFPGFSNSGTRRH